MDNISFSSHFLSLVMISEECVFLNSRVRNSHNTRNRGPENSKDQKIPNNKTIQRKVTVWHAVPDNGVVGSNYFSNGTVSGVPYHHVLKQESSQKHSHFYGMLFPSRTVPVLMSPASSILCCLKGFWVHAPDDFVHRMAKEYNTQPHWAINSKHS